MTAKELIESGIIELYCLGIASSDERILVEQLAGNNKEVEDEIAAVTEALAMYAVASAGERWPKNFKENYRHHIPVNGKESYLPEFPPRLTQASEPNDWIDYLNVHKIEDPAVDQPVTMVVLPGTKDFYTYVVFGSPGGIVDEEMHSTHNEFLLICRGECEMTIGTSKGFYMEGSFISIAPGIPHSARILGHERMIAIGQRRAA
ncbi:MAG: hypothetical protein H0V65_07135 [Chitinophagales bacterium]|nr:hypothetical protein [Chitinophagales bacterium]